MPADPVMQIFPPPLSYLLPSLLTADFGREQADSFIGLLTDTLEAPDFSENDESHMGRFNLLARAAIALVRSLSIIITLYSTLTVVSIDLHVVCRVLLGLHNDLHCPLS